MDFVALMRYAGPDERALGALEADSPAELKAVARLMRAQCFRLDNGLRSAAWEDNAGVDGPKLDRRPALPTLSFALHTPEDYYLTFGRDAFEVYHLLRWLFFLTDTDLQRAMLAACTRLGCLFGATDCIITNDESPVVDAFRHGMSFERALAAAGPEDGERSALVDLYIEWPEDYIMREVNHPRGGKRTRYKDWPIGQPSPAGWERATTWDSKGFWRLRLPGVIGRRGVGPPGSRPGHRCRESS
jgi:hypothetical protein